jgi:ribonuclease P protein component
MCAAIPTLKASQDFRRIATEGQKWVTPAFILQVFKKDSPAVSEQDAAGFRLREGAEGIELREGASGFRLGLTVSRKVGNAIVRNRTKRRLRETVRLMLQNDAEAKQLQNYDIVLIGRTAGADCEFAKLGRDLRWALKKLGVLS